ERLNRTLRHARTGIEASKGAAQVKRVVTAWALAVPAVVTAVGVTGCGGSTSGGSSSGGGASPGPVQHPSQLVGDVGHDDAFKITMTDGAGHAISNLAAGTYSVVLNDESSIHDFHLTGSGVDTSTA